MWPLRVPGISRYWELTLRNRDGLRKDIGSSLDTGKPSVPLLQVVCCRAGDETGGLDLEELRER